MKVKNDPLEKFRTALEQALFRACQIPELQDRGIQQLLLRALNTTDDHMRHHNEKENP